MGPPTLADADRFRAFRGQRVGGARKPGCFPHPWHRLSSLEAPRPVKCSSRFPQPWQVLGSTLVTRLSITALFSWYKPSASSKHYTQRCTITEIMVHPGADRKWGLLLFKLFLRTPKANGTQPPFLHLHQLWLHQLWPRTHRWRQNRWHRGVLG